MPVSARKPQLFLRAVAAILTARRTALRSGPSMGMAIPLRLSLEIVDACTGSPFNPFLPLSSHHFSCSDNHFTFLARDLTLMATLSGVESGRLCQCRDSADYVIEVEVEGMGRGEKRGRRELPVLATCIHVLVSRSVVKRGLRGSINMRMTRTAWFCALPDAHKFARINSYRLPMHVEYEKN